MEGYTSTFTEYPVPSHLLKGVDVIVLSSLINNQLRGKKPVGRSHHTRLAPDFLERFVEENE